MGAIVTAPFHTRSAFDLKRLPHLVKWAKSRVRLVKPDAIVVCGQSGIVPGAIVSYETGVPLIVIRKAGEPTVAGPSEANAVLPDYAKRWVWLDDCVASGGTLIHSAQSAYKHQLVSFPIPVACILYSSYETTKHTYPAGEYLQAFRNRWPALADTNITVFRRDATADKERTE